MQKKNVQEICKYIKKYAVQNMHKYACICKINMQRYALNMQLYALYTDICNPKYAKICDEKYARNMQIYAET